MEFTAEWKKDFEQKVASYQDLPDDDNQQAVMDCLNEMAEELLGYMAARMDLTHVRYDDIVCHSMEGIWRYDRDRAGGKAFNYFSTGMLCFIRQIAKRERNYALLREKYRQFLKKEEKQKVL